MGETAQGRAEARDLLAHKTTSTTENCPAGDSSTAKARNWAHSLLFGLFIYLVHTIINLCSIHLPVYQFIPSTDFCEVPAMTQDWTKQREKLS